MQLCDYGCDIPLFSRRRVLAKSQSRKVAMLQSLPFIATAYCSLQLIYCAALPCVWLANHSMIMEAFGNNHRRAVIIVKDLLWPMCQLILVWIECPYFSKFFTRKIQKKNLHFSKNLYFSKNSKNSKFKKKSPFFEKFEKSVDMINKKNI
jgi:hypothetical protein